MPKLVALWIWIIGHAPLVHSHCMLSCLICLQELQRSGGLHLEGFHLLVPALTVNLMEMRLLHREKSTRRDRELGNHIVPDDGFPMGACCILKVISLPLTLHQFFSSFFPPNFSIIGRLFSIYFPFDVKPQVTGGEKSFDELHWFASANRHLGEALTSLGHGTEHPKGSRIFGLKLWNQAPPSISPESHKVDKNIFLFLSIYSFIVFIYYLFVYFSIIMSDKTGCVCRESIGLGGARRKWGL